MKHRSIGNETPARLILSGLVLALAALGGVSGSVVLFEKVEREYVGGPVVIQVPRIELSDPCVTNQGHTDRCVSDMMIAQRRLDRARQLPVRDV